MINGVIFGVNIETENFGVEDIMWIQQEEYTKDSPIYPRPVKK